MSGPRPGINDLLIQFDLERTERLLKPDVAVPYRTLFRSSTCTSVDCEQNIRTLLQETTKLVNHVEKLEHLLKEKASATAEELDLVRLVRAEYTRLGATPNLSAIKDLAERLSKGDMMGSIEDSDNEDVMDSNEPLVENKVPQLEVPAAQYAPMSAAADPHCPPSHSDNEDVMDTNEPLVENEVPQFEVPAAYYAPPSAAADPHYPPSHSDNEDIMDTNKTLVENEVAQLGVPAAYYAPLSAAANPHYPPSHSPSQTLDTQSSPLSSSGLGDSD